MKKRFIFALAAFCLALTPSLSQGTKNSVDLTKMSSTMVYAKVFDMLVNPESYEGKQIKMRGTFTVFEYEQKRVFTCIVQDATACCAQGLEFRLKDNPKYPENYPAPYSEITVIGTFHQYEENGLSYILLQNSRLEP